MGGKNRRSKRLTGGPSKQKVLQIPSPQVIEEGIKPTPTVTWDPFTVLPKEIYQKIFDKLENPVDKQNFMNAHVKFYDLFKTKRTLFLSQQVFEVIGRDKDGDEDDIEWPQPNGFAKHLERLKTRLVCRDWDKAVQNYFQRHEDHFILKEDDDNYDLVPCKSFTWAGASELEKDLEKYAVTHPPSKNPIISRKIILSPFLEGPEEELRRRQIAVGTLLPEGFWRLMADTFGIAMHCWIKIERKLTPEIFLEIAKGLKFMPELKTLKLEGAENVGEPFSDKDLKEIGDVQVLQSERKKVAMLKSSYLPSVVFNKLIGDLPELKKIQIKTAKGKDSTLKDFVLPTDRMNLLEADFTVKGLEDLSTFKILDVSQTLNYLRSDWNLRQMMKAKRRLICSGPSGD